MSAEASDEAQFVLRSLLAQAEPDWRSHHVWFWEAQRWTELLVALLVRVASVPELEARALAGRMGLLELLDVAVLTERARNPRGPRARQHDARSRALFAESGIDPERGSQILDAFAEVALAVHERFGERIQRYLRRYGEEMLRELKRDFYINAISDAETADAFTYWLQNVVAMPLSLKSDDLMNLANAHGLEVDDLVSAADRMNLNVGLLDDLAALEMARRDTAEDARRRHLQP